MPLRRKDRDRSFAARKRQVKEVSGRSSREMIASERIGGIRRARPRRGENARPFNRGSVFRAQGKESQAGRYPLPSRGIGRLLSSPREQTAAHRVCGLLLSGERVARHVG